LFTTFVLKPRLFVEFMLKRRPFFFFILLQIGLCIGRLGGGLSRDCVFALVPCPRSSEGQDVVFLEGQSNLSSRESEKKKGSKGRSAPQALQIDVDWVVEHARQVF
jgi:hypothetical protein